MKRFTNYLANVFRLHPAYHSLWDIVCFSEKIHWTWICLLVISVNLYFARIKNDVSNFEYQLLIHIKIIKLFPFPCTPTPICGPSRKRLRSPSECGLKYLPSVAAAPLQLHSLLQWHHVILQWRHGPLWGHRTAPSCWSTCRHDDRTWNRFPSVTSWWITLRATCQRRGSIRFDGGRQRGYGSTWSNVTSTNLNWRCIWRGGGEGTINE